MTQLSTLHSTSGVVADALELPKPYDLPAGSAIVAEGQLSDYLFSVRSGMVRISRSDAKRADRTIGFLFPGDLVGVNCNNSNRCRYAAETMVPTTVCRWPRHYLEALVCEVPAARKTFLDEMSHEMTLIQQRMEILDLKSATARIAAFLAMMAKRCACQFDGNAGAPYPFPNGEIADFLNLSPESFRRGVQFLKRMGAVRCPRPARITIEDIGFLESYVLAAI